MAAITGLPGPAQAVPKAITKGEKKDQIAKADAVFKQIDFETGSKSQYPSLKEMGKMIGGFALAAGFLALTYYAARSSLSALPPQTGGMVCKPTLPQQLAFQPRARELIGLVLPQSLPPQQIFIPANEVEARVDNTQQQYDTFDRTYQASWNRYNDWEKQEAQATLKSAIGEAVRAKVVCLTGEPFNPQSWHLTVAKFLSLPYTGASEMYTAFNAVRVLNENFNNQTISDTLFVEFCEEFSNQAWLRDQNYSLNDDGEWVLNNFKPWMSAVQQVLDVYQKPMRNALFSELAQNAETVLGIKDLKKYNVAPVRTQIIALDAVRTSAITRLNQGADEEHKGPLLFLLSQSSYYLSHLRAAELTGSSYYERTVTQNPFLIDNYQEITAVLFRYLYWWYEEDGSANYQFQFYWNNALPYAVAHPETVHPYSEGFTPQSTANLLTLLRSEALRLNNTVTYMEGPMSVNLSSTIALIDGGVE